MIGDWETGLPAVPADIADGDYVCQTGNGPMFDANEALKDMCQPKKYIGDMRYLPQVRSATISGPYYVECHVTGLPPSEASDGQAHS